MSFPAMQTSHLSPFERNIFADVLRCREMKRREKVTTRLDHRCTFYVIARNREWFMEFVRQSGLKLQQCKYISVVERGNGIDFSSTLKELVVISGWLEGRVGDEIFLEECFQTISRYCLQKRIHQPLKWTL